MSVERRAIAAVKWVAVGRIASQAATWAITILVMRILHPGDYGLMALVAVVTTIASAISEAGVNSSIVQTRALDPSLLRKLAGLTLLTNAVVFLSLVAVAPTVALAFKEPGLQLLLQAAAFQFLLGGLSAVPHSLAVRDLRFRFLAAVDFTGNLVGSLSTLAMAWLGWSVWSLVGGSLVGAATRMAILLLYGARVSPSFDLRGLSSQVGFGSRLAASTILWTIIMQSDAMIGGHFLDATQLGIYAVALHLATLPMQKLMSVINQVAFSAISRLQDEAERLRSRMLLSQRVLSTVAVPMLWGLAVVAPELLALLLGDKWAGAVIPMQLVAAAIPLRMTTTLMTTAMLGVGRSDLALRVTLTAGVVLPACFAIGAQWGAVGLAASWLVAIPVSFGLNFPRICGAIGIRVSAVLASSAMALIAGALMISAVVLAREVLPPLPLLATLLALVATGAATYVVAIALLDREILSVLRELILPRTPDVPSA